MTQILTAVGLLALAGMARGLDSAPPPNPITVKEIGESLRSGTPSATLVSAVTSRRLLDSPKIAEEADLRAAGASPQLIETLKSGAYTLSPFEANSARRRMAAALAAATPPPAATPTVAPATTGNDPAVPVNIADLLRGKMVTWQGSSLQSYDETKLAGKKYYALYYSAQWCPPCRKFTPKLVQFYEQVAAKHPELEVVFFSSDKTSENMQKYMQEDRMPWPAIRYELLSQAKQLRRYRGNGIPCLVVVDENGKVLADSYEGEKYVGPYKPARELAKLLNVPPIPPP